MTTLVRTVRTMTARPNRYGISQRLSGYCGGCDGRSFELRRGTDGVARCFACHTFGDIEGSDL